LKAIAAWSDHQKASFFNKFVSDVAIIAKFLMNLRQYLTRPKKAQRLFTVVGIGYYLTTVILDSSTWTLSFVTICLRYSIFSGQKNIWRVWRLRSGGVEI